MLDKSFLIQLENTEEFIARGTIAFLKKHFHNPLISLKNITLRWTFRTPDFTFLTFLLMYLKGKVYKPQTFNQLKCSEKNR